MTVALVTGVSGQDGTLLAERLHREGARVVGVSRNAVGPRVAAAVAEAVRLDVGDGAAIAALVARVKPDECYHLAAHHHSAEGGDEDDAEFVRVNVGGTSALLDALARHRPDAGVFLASSCHVFGDPVQVPQSEATPFAPDTPYARSKAEVVRLGAAARSRGQRVSSGILYNHESPLRSDGFVTARIARGVAEIARGRRSDLTVGSLTAAVDWSWAEDVVDAMLRMARAAQPGDFVVASGELHSVGELATISLARAGLDASRFLREDPAVRLRPARRPYVGDASRIAARLGWRPTVGFREIAERLVDAALAAA